MRATMVRLLNALARGTAAVRPLLAERLVDALNHGEHPRVRPLGGIGLADLGPLTDLAVDLFADVELAAKEALRADQHQRLLDRPRPRSRSPTPNACSAPCAPLAALELEAFAANLTPLHPAVAEARGHPGLRAESAGLRALLDGSPLHAPGAARNLQDPLSFRGTAAVLGAARDALAQAERVLAIELVAPQENPLPGARGGPLHLGRQLRVAAARRGPRLPAHRPRAVPQRRERALREAPAGAAHRAHGRPRAVGPRGRGRPVGVRLDGADDRPRGAPAGRSRSRPRSRRARRPRASRTAPP